MHGYDDPQGLPTPKNLDGESESIHAAINGTNGNGKEERIAQLRQALVNQATIIVELRREVSRLRLLEETAFPKRKRFSQL